MTISNDRELIVWQKACDLAGAMYVATRHFPREVRYGITEQMRRPSASVPANIAEGMGRTGSAEFCHHVSVALGSLYETRTWTELARRFGYLSAQGAAALDALADEKGAMLYALCARLRKPK